MAATRILKDRLLKISFKQIGIAILILKFLLIGYFIYIISQGEGNVFSFDSTFFTFVGIGFFAQLIDGALGMAYGASSTALLLHFGVSPRIASASVHTAEVFTTGVSGLSHLRFKNIDKTLLIRLVIPGVIGAVLGAYLLSDILDGGIVKPYISAYLLILGTIILYKGIRNRQKEKKEVKKAGLLAFFGGLLDAIGGGGWGPIVTSNIINQGKSPRETIGTVNTAEFFITFFATGIFLYYVGIDSWQVVLGLIIGGVFAAPIGAFLASRINKRVLFIVVGLVVILTSSLTIYNALNQYSHTITALLG
ncbi:sulfite exporter TauE/SafE family protein [Sinomicrobium pectinilyticum]|uniref:Probable membrane transporter protein n=1 Tax=Sinomicrobium pectinilyticum TaxID=1084421 RepID=A0A3N0F4R0_SINP1|nr:sulfite exporter TauE/SafE family protein [Sinomicrobium pectinilyticum]RNL95153.1 sulfite exporter TauE/SafE family protein [Sinomicrobium pectinilyticum]